MAGMEEGLSFYPADFALVGNNHQVANVSSDHIRDLRFSLLPLEPDTLFSFLIDFVHSTPLGSHCRENKNKKKEELFQPPTHYPVVSGYTP